jgi:hypothetical protein
MKKVFFLVVYSILFSVGFAQTQTQPPAKKTINLGDYGIRMETDKRLIVVMASLEAAEIDTPLSETGEIFRQTVRQDLASLNPELRIKIKSFIGQYKRRFSEKYKTRLSPDDAKKFDAILAKNNKNLSKEESAKYKSFITEFTAPFVSLAFALSPVPNLSDPDKIDDLPGELLEVFDYAPLVREFYRKSGIDSRLAEFNKTHSEVGVKMLNQIAVMSLNLLDYLHTRPELTVTEKIKTERKEGKKILQQTEARVRDRRFFVIPDLLGVSNIARFRNIGDDYYLIIPPDINFESSEIRRAYLQFTFDTLVLKNNKEISQLRAGIKQLLESRIKAGTEVSPDIYLAVARSLVAAADVKQKEYAIIENATYIARLKIDKATNDDEKKAISGELFKLKSQQADIRILELSEAYEKGAVLAFYFADQFKQLEGGGFDIAGYLQDMLLSIDVGKEMNRLEANAAVIKRATVAREELRKLGTQEIVINAAEFERQKTLQAKLKNVDILVENKKYDEAEKELNQLEKDFTDFLSVIYYNKGRVASAFAGEAFDESLRDERLGKAAINYGNAIRSATTKTEKAVLSLAHVGLGKILEFYDRKADALKQYDEAIKLGNIGAYNEALARKAKLTQNQ